MEALVKSNKKQNKLPDIPCDDPVLDEVSSPQIPWHPAFIEALQLELEAYKDVLEFIPELQLTTEPLRIDCVVIKKTKEVKIDKNIGKIFRTWNLIEYKSPDDYVAVKDFYKVYGYACIYAYLNETPITDLTITFVESHYPRELLKHLEKVKGYTVAKTSSGIYNVVGDIIPIQIIDSRKLTAEENVWLRSLRSDLDYSDVELINIKIAQQRKSLRVGAYAYAVMHSYYKKTMEDRYMTSGVSLEYEQAFMKKFKPLAEKAGWFDKWKAEARQEFQTVIADKDAKIEQLQTQIAELQSNK